jgi:hypothetical protein
MDTDEFAGIKLINGSFAISAYDDGISSASNIYIEGWRRHDPSDRYRSS